MTQNYSVHIDRSVIQSGSVTVPGSKSFSNRALMLAAFCAGTVEINNLLSADDTDAGLGALKSLGLSVSGDAPSVSISGPGSPGFSDSQKLYVGSAGTVARFLPAMLATVPGTWKLEASEQMSRRPMSHLLASLRQLGLKVDCREDRYPLTLHSPGLQHSEVTTRGDVSSQFVSALVMMGACSGRPAFSTIVESEIVQAGYVDITRDVLASFGVSSESKVADGRTTITTFDNRVTLNTTNYWIESDYSTASYFAALACLSGTEQELVGLKQDSVQPDRRFISLLEEAGGLECRWEDHHRVTLNGSGLANLADTYDFTENSDTALTMLAVAAVLGRPLSVHGIGHIRSHECDRLHVFSRVLSKCGVNCTEHEDGISVHGGKLHYAEVDSFDDHRIAMSASILGLFGDGIRINNAGAVAKTCPTFFTELERLGATVEVM